jgi:hypothetical protein
LRTRVYVELLWYSACMAFNPNLGDPVVTRQYLWHDMAVRAWGAEWNAPDRGAYEFSNGRQFDSTDRTQSGIYNPELDTQGA